MVPDQMPRGTSKQKNMNVGMRLVDLGVQGKEGDRRGESHRGALHTYMDL